MTPKGETTDPTEHKVLEALDDKQWSWRTLDGLTKSTGLSESEVLSTLKKYKDIIRVGQSLKYGLIYQLAERTEPAEEPFIEKALDYLSMGRRGIA